MFKPEEIWQCQTNNYGYMYDPDKGDRKGKIPKGVKFEELPDFLEAPCARRVEKMLSPACWSRF
jgi:rubredoxin